MCYKFLFLWIMFPSVPRMALERFSNLFAKLLGAVYYLPKLCSPLLVNSAVDQVANRYTFYCALVPAVDWQNSTQAYTELTEHLNSNVQRIGHIV